MSITFSQSTALKGLAILTIVMHNVIHMLSPVQENEFGFSFNRVATFLTALPHSPLESLFSFYGWLGVPVFIFISGYGLTVKYGDGKFNPYHWLSRHYLRFILLMLPCYALYIAFVHRIDPLRPIDFHQVVNQQLLMLPCYALYIAFVHRIDPLRPIDFHQVVNQQLLLLNLSDPEAIDPGVYWYLGLALQLYAWFLLLRRLPSRWVVVITAVCWAMTAFSPDAMVTWLRYNSPGWMTEFSAGILLGRYQGNEATFRACHDKFKYFHTPSGTEGDTSHSCSCFIKLSTPWLYVPGCLALIFLCSLSPYTFTLSGLLFVLLLLPYRHIFTRARALLYLGSISAALYVIHPVVRRVIIVCLRRFDIDLYPTLAAVAVLIISVIGAHIYTRILHRIW